MDSNLYRRNVLATLSVKPAKAGLRRIASNTVRTNVSHAIVGFCGEVSELLVGMADYLLGVKKLTQIEGINILEEMGDIGYYLVVGCKFAKVKVPGSGKKVKLVGMTLGKALMELNRLAADLQDLFHRNAYYGPKYLEDGKTVDVVATEALEAERLVKTQAILAEAVALYWPLCYELFAEPPATVFEANINKLTLRYGAGYFSMTAQEARDKDAEAKVLKETATLIAAQNAKKQTAVAGSA